MTSYDVIYERFLQNIEDLDLAKMSNADRQETLLGYMKSALALMELNGVSFQNDLSQRDDDSEEFEADLTLMEIEIIATYMTASWFTPKINSLEHTSLFVGVSGEKWTDQQAHLAMMTSARDNWLNEARKLCRNYRTLNNTYIRDQR